MRKRNEMSIGAAVAGAYERFWKESNGAVVAILNPKIMRQRPVTSITRRRHPSIVR